MLSETAISRLRELQAYLKDSAFDSRTFDMSTWHRANNAPKVGRTLYNVFDLPKNACGTAHCLAGHTEILFKPLAEKYKPTFFNAQHILDLSSAQAYDLFMLDSPLWRHKNLQDVNEGIRVIDQFIENWSKEKRR